MDYIKWNDLIGDFFFGNEDNLGKTIFLYIDKDLLVEIFKSKYFSDNRSHNEIWKDFIECLNNPIIRTDSFGRHFDCTFSANEESYKERLEKLIRWYNINNDSAQSRYPIYISFLVLPIMAKAQYQSLKVKEIVRRFFEDNGVRYVKSDFVSNEYLLKSICFSNGENGGLWRDLHEWSIYNGYGITYYDFDPTYDSNWKYVNMVLDQCLLTKNEKIKARELYDIAGLNVNSTYSFRDFKNHLLLNRGKFRHYFDRSVIRELTTNRADVLYKVLYNDFNKWDGSYDEQENESHRNVQSHYIRVCCEINRASHTFVLQYRLKEKFDGTLNVYYNGKNKESVIRLEHGEWSTPLESTNIRNVEGAKHRNVFRFNPSDVYLLTKAKDFEGCIFVSRDELLFEGNRVFFITQIELESLPNLSKLNYTNEDGYSLYRYDVKLTDQIVSEGGLLYRFVASNEDRNESNNITLEGGLYLRQHGTGVRGYLNDFPPVLYDRDFLNEMFICDCNNPTNRYSLSAVEFDETDDHKTWNLPDRLLPGIYNVENTKLRIAIIDRYELQAPIIEKHPYIKSDGSISFDNPNEICMIDNEITSDFNGAYPQTYLCHYNNKLTPRHDEYKFTYGDYLVDWLYWNGDCSRDDFIKAFQVLQEKLESQRTELKILAKYATPNAALRWLEKGGYVDVISETNKIIPCSPRFVILPVTEKSCNKFRLVGCRSLTMLNQIREICRNHQEMFRYQVEQTSDDLLIERLTPSSIFIETTGTSLNDFGLQNIIRYLCSKLDIKEPIVNYLYHLNQFAPKTTELSGEWNPFSNNNPYLDCKCYMFDESRYEYDQSRFYLLNDLFNTVNDFKLIKISHSTYRNDYVVLDGITRRYIKVNDESHAKMFVLFKNDPMKWQGRDNLCIKKVNNSQTGYTDIYVAKRIDLPKALVRYCNFISITPPRINTEEIPNSPLRYYVYPIHNDLDINQIVSIISRKTGTNLNPNPTNL